MAHEGLWEQLGKLEWRAGRPAGSRFDRTRLRRAAPDQTRLRRAQRAKCQYMSNPERYVVALLNTEYVVNLSQREIFSLRPPLSPAPAGFLERLCILTYLINARDLPLANKLVKGESLPGGQFFFQGVHKLPTQKLEKAFGDCPQTLYQLLVQFNAKRREFGDASIELDVFPRVPLTIVIWRRDEEFAARASILFDQGLLSKIGFLI